MNESKTYDVSIIGSGPGGYVAAIRAAQLGLSVQVIELEPRLGGVCTLRGCIPTKALLHTADLLEEARHGADIGVMAREIKLEMAGAQKHKEKVVRQSSNGVSYLMKKNRVDVTPGFGRIAGPGRVAVKAADGSESEFGAKNILLATGSSPRSLPGIDIDHRTILSSDSILDLAEVPKSLLVIGSGAVGVEFASMFARFGSKATVIEVLPRIVPVEDEEISRELAASFKRQGIAVYVDTRVEKVTKMDNGVEVLARTSGGKTETFRAEKMLLAVGRKPLSEGIGLEAAGVATDRGYIRVDGMMRTNVSGIYAIGDVVPTAWLAHVASAEGIVAVEHLAGKNPPPLNYDQVPGCTYCSPEIGSIGLTEAKARERGYDVVVGKFPFSAIGKARIINETAGFVKIVAEKKYDEVLGVHIIGPKATELISEAGAALRLEATSEELVRTIHAHPTLSEAMHEAAEAVAGHAIHI
ncbi:MAG: dihydrolipoyl dehydrogenase [Acidobacteria bacterium]|nr:dihydrolipoyl dehydrogenase [Acidobacteriota bacterium]MCA1610147.1 dihydrolipoyl dehydrogenase [Acidobacteriota bacterium]MCA1617266.1 dihydrolipoyl dehydrogenase [Acidobacteriota bacterium]